MVLRQKIDETNQKMTKLSQEFEQLNREYEELFGCLEINPDELADKVANQDNYSPQEWEELQSERKKLDEKLTLDLSNIPNLSKTKKNRKQLGSIERHWIFVR